MPIITTLSTARSPAPRPVRRAAGARRTTAGRRSRRCQVAAEALVAGGAEAAAHGAAGLRRHAQRAAVGLGDEDGLDGVAAADVEQPLHGAVGRTGSLSQRQGRALGHAGELVAQRLRQVGHRAKSDAPRWWIQRKSCTARKALLAQPFAVPPARPSRSKSSRLTMGLRPRPWRGWPPPVRGNSSTGGHLRSGRQRCRRSCRGRRTPISTAAVSGASEPCTALASMLSAKSARMVPLSAFFGSVAPISSRFLAIAPLAFEHLDHHRAGDHEDTRSLKNGRALCTA
jgi:hypothetical protein